ncbi:hypothetical protein Gorai_002710 [Gossypium raimondii]|uniref:Uncharacterized protein n=1 Tax=Gossypium raimondii TaxID=29730 RepID=A0A7J8QMM8_GOSRA|nr:hypothetical protein [Gossypium raimondii]
MEKELEGLNIDDGEEECGSFHCNQNHNGKSVASSQGCLDYGS